MNKKATSVTMWHVIVVVVVALLILLVSLWILGNIRGGFLDGNNFLSGLL